MERDRLLALVKAGPVLWDGAMGTMLQQQGLRPGACPELWNIENRDEVRSIHAAYIEAGARIISTNTFGGNRLKLGAYGLEDRVKELNSAGVTIAREVASGENFVAASIGPTGKFLEPLGDLSFEEAANVFAEQAEAQASAGADVILTETFSDLEEAKAALCGAQQCGLPCFCTMAFDTGGCTMMGVDPPSAAKALAMAGAEAVGANCGVGPGEMLAIIKQVKESTELPVMAQPNAGVPRVVEGAVIYDATPEDMAEFAAECADLGVSIIGACCGSTPQHIYRMAKRLQME